ncbi:hypothetical protein TRFO_16615 [Tritrichomonas foetus]|uniref:PPM-type phosphatase domain-containing protein n=1 Tax=Tritrichomonas foetus TaxID=1144522 RepID=A0A1J4KQA6_9EUKA|nr:hypothetical protein TRFO_16615 [Tritrichomonas foetus]|eukprot:OHT13290.1 hypothetical protein TRFO_16615 [Tritrichomonas foetus]
MRLHFDRSGSMFGTKTSKNETQISSEVRCISITHKNLENFPYQIPENNHLHRLDLSYNRMKSLPLNLTQLYTLFLAYNDFHEFPESLIDSISTYTSLDSLDISHNELKSFPVNIEKVTCLKKLDVSNNNIEYISYLKTSANTVDLLNNKLEVVPRIPKELTSLFVDRNRIATFDKSFKFLHKLSLGYNKLENIIPTISLISLEFLILPHNLIKEMPNLKECTPKLKYFDASWNKLTKFPNFPKTIETIFLSNNRITELPSLVDFEYLAQFDISHNNVVSVPKLPSAIINANFYDNFIENFEDSIVPSLRIINLCSNKLKSVPSLHENKIPFLVINFNCLQNFHFNFVYNFLTKLDLSNNELETIPNEIFSISYLYNLNLSSNRITKFDIYDFTNSKLAYLNLSNNKICTLPPNLPQNLEYLYVSNCGLSNFPENFEKNNSEIYYLDISENEISNIPLFPYLTTFKGSSNKFSRFPKFSEGIRFVDLSFNQIKQFPSINYQKLTFLDLSHNLLTTFISPQTIHHLYLSYNPLASIKTYHLDHLDISGCPCDRIKIDNVKQFITSDSKMMSNSSPTVLCHYFGDLHSILQHKYRDAFFSFQQIHGYYVFCILNAHDYQTLSQKSLYVMLNKLHARKNISSDYLKDLCDTVISDIDSIVSNPTTMLALGFLREKSMIIAYFGGFAITVLNAKGEIMREYGREIRKDDGLSNLTRQGEKIIFKINRGTTIRQISSKNDEKWMVIAPTFVLDTISTKTYVDVVSSSNNACEIARRLRNHVIASSYKDSFSICVLGFE